MSHKETILRSTILIMFMPLVGILGIHVHILMSTLVCENVEGERRFTDDCHFFLLIFIDLMRNQNVSTTPQGFFLYATVSINRTNRLQLYKPVVYA